MTCDQLFCKPIDIQELRLFLNKISYEINGGYLIGYHAYKKLVFHDLQTEFCELFKPYYHKSKQYYIDRKINYKSFTTVMRQICKYNSIKLTSRVRYIESNYTNEYTIYIENPP
jgi:hypothetical protein